MSKRLAQTSHFLFTLMGSWDQQTGRRYDLEVRGFFSAEGALHFARTRLSEPARRRSWIADHAPKGWIGRGDGSHGKVIRRLSAKRAHPTR